MNQQERIQSDLIKVEQLLELESGLAKMERTFLEVIRDRRLSKGHDLAESQRKMLYEIWNEKIA